MVDEWRDFDPERKPGTATPDLSRFGPITIGDLDKLPKPEWLLNGILPAGELCFLYGEPEGCKSFFAQHLAYGVATSGHFAGRQTKTGRVLYFLAEGVQRMKLRKKAWETHHGISLAVAPVTFLTKPGDWKFGCADAKDLIEGICALQPILVIIDTLTQHLFGSYSDDAAAAAFCHTAQAISRRCGATVLAVHHQGKDADKGLMGSTVFRGAARSVLLAQKHGDRVVVAVKHANDGNEGERMAFDITSVPDSASIVLEPREMQESLPLKAKPKPLSQDIELARRALVDLANELERNDFSDEEYRRCIIAVDIIPCLPDDPRKRYKALHKFRGRLERHGVVHWKSKERMLTLGNRAFET